MTLSWNQISQYFLSLKGRGMLPRNNFPRLDVYALNARDLRDLNLPPGLSNRLTSMQGIEKIHRGL
jgi:hypothetical protein